MLDDGGARTEMGRWLGPVIVGFVGKEGRMEVGCDSESAPGLLKV